MEQDDNTNYTIDHDNIGKRGYPMHYRSYNVPPPMKKVERKPENTNSDPNK